MKPKEKKPETVYRIIGESGHAVGSYSRACHDEYDFGSMSEARSANCHGEFRNKAKYKIAKYRVTYELIDGDCDPATGEEIKEEIIKTEQDAALEKEMDERGLKGWARVNYSITKHHDRFLIDYMTKQRPFSKLKLKC